MFTPFMSHGTMHQEPLNMPETRTFADLRTHGWRPFPECLTAGFVGALPLIGRFAQVFPALIIGRRSAGKTVLLRFLAAQAALHGINLVLWDCAGHLLDGRATAGATIASTWPEIDTLAGVLDAELSARQQGHVRGGPPILLVVDDWPELAANCPRARRTVARLITSGASLDLYIVLAGCLLAADDFERWALSGRSLVERAAARYCLAAGPRAAMSAGLAPSMWDRPALLAPGQALFCQPDASPVPISIPLTFPGDLADALAERIERALTVADGVTPPAHRADLGQCPDTLTKVS